ncbi:hypothetical protein CP965_03330 [Halarcobacter mediterraneus]|uniref:HPP transmembrane region domain-containing protein n=1 Tax=Halarcobacter mediterraneus TaxID=2023153 RepID=A0A4Q1AWP7_9BACT|nr:HPP family protein [Halarcobacter mediterraneus]RXK14495.1 hypothetical protein CP965_03330 [Halarcobacter mediterraneus]
MIFGHFIATFVGLFFFHIIGPQWWSMALALASAIALMMIAKVVHPPALFYNNLHKNKVYPIYW